MPARTAVSRTPRPSRSSRWRPVHRRPSKACSTAPSPTPGVRTRARVLGRASMLPGPRSARTGIRGQRIRNCPTGTISISGQLAFNDGPRPAHFVENGRQRRRQAERVKGVAQGLRLCVSLIFGTGIGLGLVTQGRLMPGSFGNGRRGSAISRWPCGGGHRLAGTALGRLSVAAPSGEGWPQVTDGNDLRDLYTAKKSAA